MSLTDISFSRLTSCWEHQVYDTRLPAYKHRLYPTIATLNTPLGDHFSYIFDFHRSRLVFLSNTFADIVGYQPTNIPTLGLKIFDIMHPADSRAVFHGYQQIWQYLHQLPMELRNQFRATIDYRIKKRNGDYVRLLQELQTFSIDNLGNIIFTAGRCCDISHWGKSKELTLIMEDPNHIQRFQIPRYQGKDQLFLSKREKEILKLLACGKSSKAVANDLAISYHTVNTHRQNMLNKMGIRKTAGLVNFALNHGII